MPKLNLPSFFGGKTSQPASSGPTVSPSVTVLAQGTTNVKDVIAPEAIEVDWSDIKINDTYYRTLFVAGYPRFVNANWLSPLINFPHSLSISMFIYPIDGKGVIEDLRRKIAEMEAELQGDIQRGRIINIDTQVKLEDARSLQEQLAKGAERFFQFGLYITIRDDKKDVLDRVTNHIKSALGALLISAKTASLQIEDGFKTTLPTGLDKLKINRNMDTTSLATTFPFTSSELTANEGLMYGINEHNDSLVIFDRFTLENANMVIFAKSGAGKSYLVKLEILRSLLFETEVIVIDPEDESHRTALILSSSPR
ncbi:MAG: Type IV secretory pathway VirB4 component-like protein [Microgenomates group bacterium GW2011_GWC2_45_8]|nr:MAG: Type IV secretory pathway VirB4 component-like protein [Microgenomates group bacterium GW2011_GWC2_45_8]